MNEALRSPLTVEQIRDSELPRGFRGLDEGATRRRLAEIADHYERLVTERDELRRRLTELEAAPPAADDHEEVVAERDELRRRVAEVEAAARDGHSELAAERDELRRRVAELEASVAERKDYNDVAAARAKLERDVADLEELLSSRDDYEAIVAERDELRHRLVEAEARGETEQALSRALLAASRASEELVKEAQAEADAIVAAARGSAAETERELEKQRRSLESERETFLESLRGEALQMARGDLTALQQEAEPLVAALAAFTRRVRAMMRLELTTTEDEPAAELLDDLQARTEPSEAALPSADSH